MDMGRDGLRFRDKVVMVTGGCQGIGRACVDEFGKSLLLLNTKHNYCFAVGLTSNLFVCSEVNMATWQYS